MNRHHSLLAVTMALGIPNAAADPCGMVPPLNIAAGDQPLLERVGIQRTYVAHHNGIETMVLRPGFQGQIDNFGMLIPFPSPPAIRKIDDDTFAHIEAALTPPSVQLALYRPDPSGQLAGGIGGLIGAKGYGSGGSGMGARGTGLGGGGLAYHEVNVVREEAVGMYEVAVLEAGSPAALSRWMTEHGYRYPEGMDDVTAEYVAEGWCFVAIKARIGAADSVEPRPGMRSADPQLPSGASFDGHVQGMGFRFHVDEPVVPMRLSVFNGEDPHNVVYMLSDAPVTIEGLPEDVVTHHISGEQLYQNLTEPLALTVLAGELDWLGDDLLQELEQKRDPGTHSAVARDLFAADLQAMQTNTLALSLDEQSTKLLNISEALALRGAEIDALHSDALRSEQQHINDAALSTLRTMHMTVVSGVLPTALLRDENLTFVPISDEHTIAITDRRDPLQPAGLHGHGFINADGHDILRGLDGQDQLAWQALPTQPIQQGSMSTPTLLQVSGPLESSLIDRALRRRRNALQYCYLRTLRTQPGLRGTATVRIMVGADGRVVDATTTQSVHGAVDACLENQLRRMSFPQASGPTLLQLRLRFHATPSF